MPSVKINRKFLYESLLKEAISSENYEGAASIRDILPTIGDNEIIEIDDVDNDNITEDR